MRTVCLYLSLCFVASIHSAGAQQVNLESFQQRIAAAFSSVGVYPKSVTFAGNLTIYAGSQQDSGNLSLVYSADGSTSESWSVTSESYSFAQGPLNSLDPSRNCLYVDGKAHKHHISGANCLRSVPWFLPSLAIAPPHSTLLAVTDTTTPEDAASGIERLTYTQQFPTTSMNSDSLALLQGATAFSLCYDVQSALPTRLVYQQALDSDDSRGIEVEIRFGEYRNESGYMFPHHLQRYVQRTLNADYNINTATIR